LSSFVIICHHLSSFVIICHCISENTEHQVPWWDLSKSSCHLTIPEDLTSGQPVYSGDPLVAISLIYYLVIFVWILELLHAISQFVVMFTVPLAMFFAFQAPLLVWRGWFGILGISHFLADAE